jgi:hypothetical protein
MNASGDSPYLDSMDSLRSIHDPLDGMETRTSHRMPWWTKSTVLATTLGIGFVLVLGGFYLGLYLYAEHNNADFVWVLVLVVLGLALIVLCILTCYSALVLSSRLVQHSNSTFKQKYLFILWAWVPAMEVLGSTYVYWVRTPPTTLMTRTILTSTVYLGLLLLGVLRGIVGSVSLPSGNRPHLQCTPPSVPSSCSGTVLGWGATLCGCYGLMFGVAEVGSHHSTPNNWLHTALLGVGCTYVIYFVLWHWVWCWRIMTQYCKETHGTCRLVWSGVLVLGFVLVTSLCIYIFNIDHVFEPPAVSAVFFLSIVYMFATFGGVVLILDNFEKKNPCTREAEEITTHSPSNSPAPRRLPSMSSLDV